MIANKYIIIKKPQIDVIHQKNVPMRFRNSQIWINMARKMGAPIEANLKSIKDFSFVGFKRIA